MCFIHNYVWQQSLQEVGQVIKTPSCKIISYCTYRELHGNDQY